MRWGKSLRDRAKRRPSTACRAAAEESSQPVTPPRPPPSGYDLDRLNYHIDLKRFGKDLQSAANAVFSGDRRSKYTQVSALLLSWEDEDPELPVSVEIGTLRDVFVDIYDFEVEEWRIPAVNSHTALNLKILHFLADSDTKHLKIVYYAGHGKLSNHGQALWTSHRNSDRERPPTVKWSGIQNALEESQSDVLILLDCCASGLSNTDEGNGVTELIASCAFNNTANGVGQFSFTHALISQLRRLVHNPFFTVGYLYNLLYAEIQRLPVKDSKFRKPPVHLVLTQDHRLPRSITLSPKRQGVLGPISQNLSLLDNLGSTQATSSEKQTSTFPLPGSSPVGSSEYPRLLFSIRIGEDIKPKDLCAGLFADWLSTVPIETKSIRVEAGFASDSTLLMVSMPIAMLGYLPQDPAISVIGITRSSNLLATENRSLAARVTAHSPGFSSPHNPQVYDQLKLGFLPQPQSIYGYAMPELVEYHPLEQPPTDKLQCDLLRIEKRRADDDEEEEEDENKASEDEKSRKKRIKRGKRKAVSPPIRKHRHHRKDGGSGSRTGRA